MNGDTLGDVVCPRCWTPLWVPVGALLRAVKAGPDLIAPVGCVVCEASVSVRYVAAEALDDDFDTIRHACAVRAP